jgi:hypothetical protein
MTIHTVGDSHCVNGWSSLHVKTHHIGALLCYSFGKDKLNRINIRNFRNIRNGDTIIFCLGEIDCRCHIHKHVSETNTYQSIIDSIVSNYMDAIKLNICEAGLSFKYVCVYNVVPPIEKHNTHENPEYPYLGTDEERKNYVTYFNAKLHEKCKENNFVFFDVYEKYADERGFLRKDLSDNNVHIRNGIYLTEFIETYLQ